MQKTGISLISVGVGIALAIIIAFVTTAVADAQDTSELEQIVHRKVNSVRANRGLQQVRQNKALQTVTRAHSADMYENRYFGHKNPRNESPLGRAWATWNQTDCNVSIGENLALIWAEKTRGEFDYDRITETAVKLWMASTQGHRENMLDEQWTTTGIGVTIGKRDGRQYPVYITQNFCV